ncbi:MAG TPA: heme-binding domain-containing protein [Lacunisphaera sp.]
MIKKALLGLGLLFVVAQFIRPAKNISLVADTADISTKFTVPPDAKRLLQNACYDCHSNRTRYPWYAEIQPVGWWLAKHVKDGKAHLNFSEFATYSPKRTADKLDQISDEVSQQAMPLPSYKWGHPEARLTVAQMKLLTDWADNLHDEIAPD